MRICLLHIIILACINAPILAQSPGGVSGNLQLWLKANTGTSTTTNGADVHSWTDKSPNAFSASDALTGSAPNYVTNAINFNPGLDFNGTSDGYDLGSNYLYSTNAGLHIYAVTKPDASTAKTAQFIFDFGSYASNGYGLIASDDNVAGYIIGTSTSVAITQTQIPMLVGAKFDFGTSFDLYKNGLSINSSAIATASLTAANINENATHIATSGPVTIGRQSQTNNLASDNGRYHDGTIAELVVYNEDISAASKLKIESYLAIKYGITLGNTTSPITYTASDATTVWTASATYQNDIAGIARDDASGLYQKQSKSGETDAILTMGLGSIAADNASNTNTIASDKSFMLWGNNNGSLTEISSELPSKITTRLAREWKIQETGTIGTVDITANISGITVSGSHISDFYLLIDRDGDSDFTTGTLIRHTAFGYSGGVLDFQNIDFQNGDIFTIGTSVTQVAGLTHAPTLWLKADQGTSTTTNNAAVTSWTSISPDNNIAQQATATK